MALPPTSFLDLPPEVRVKIYEFAIPQQIIVKKYSPDLVANHEIITSGRDDFLPKFMFANHLIMEECLPLFWGRVIFDTTDFELQTNTYKLTPQPFIFTSPQWLSLIQNVKALATFTGEAGIFADDFSVPGFPKLKSVTLTVPPAEMEEGHLRRLYVSLRHGKEDVATGQKVDYSLELLLDQWLQAWLQVQNGNTDRYGLVTTHESRMNVLAEKFEVYVQLYPQTIEQAWLYIPQYGVVHEVNQSAIMHTTYSWNLDLLTCSFDGVQETTKDIMSVDHDAYFLGTPLPGIEGEHVYPKLYHGAKHIMARKRRGVLEVLIHKEMSRRAITPDLETQRWNTRGESR